MKKERKKSPRSKPVDLSKQDRICHMVNCDKPGINPYIFDEQIIFYCDECMPSGNMEE